MNLFSLKIAPSSHILVCDLILQFTFWRTLISPVLTWKKKNQTPPQQKLFLPSSPSQEHDDVPVYIICKKFDNQVSEADETLPYVQVT